MSEDKLHFLLIKARFSFNLFRLWPVRPGQFGLGPISNWKRKTYRFIQTTHCHSTFPKRQTCVLHQQFISHWIFPALLLLCTVKLTCQLGGCQPWAGLPPCLGLAVHSLPSPIPPTEKHCHQVSTLLRAIKSALLLWCLYFTALWSRCSLETMVLYPGKLWCLLLLCCITWTNLFRGCRRRQKEQAEQRNIGFYFNPPKKVDCPSLGISERLRRSSYKKT